MKTKNLGCFQPTAVGSRFATALVVIALLGCGGVEQSPTTKNTAEVVPVASEPTRALPEATLPDGSRFTLELALTNDEIGQGLMFRNSLPDDRGMLFVFKEERVPSFWMKNTLIPLDMVFLSPEGAVIDIIENARPCKSEPCPQYVPRVKAMAVLEVAAGVVATHGLSEGDIFEFERVPDYPKNSLE